jgi:hypothetical protein
MSKKLVIVIIFLVVGVLGLGFVFGNDLISWIKPRENFNHQVGEKTSKSAEKISFDLTEWKDPAGFSFEYPKEVKINNHPEDETNYAFLELTAAGKEGKIIILCRDSQYATLADWFKKDETVKLGNALDTKVASVSAKRVALGVNREISGLMDADGVFYTIERQDPDDSYWREAYKVVLNSFKFIPLAGETASDFSNWMGNFDTESVDAVEPVETVE